MTNENTQDGASILQGAAAGTPITEGVHILAAQIHVLLWLSYQIRSSWWIAAKVASRRKSF